MLNVLAEVGTSAEGFRVTPGPSGFPPCLARLSPIPSSSSPWVLPGALLTAFWPPPPHPWPTAAPASLYMYKLPINRTAAIMLSVLLTLCSMGKME